jgi:putative hemolysin
MKTLTFTTLAFLVATLPAFARGGSSTVGPGNPAAIFCENEGGRLESTHTRLGDDALCRFGERSAIPQWTFFRAKNGGGEKAVDVFLNPKAVKVGVMGNPASLYCLAQGGKTSIESLEDGTQIGICRFEDRSGIEEWTLFRGVNDATNAELVKALR